MLRKAILEHWIPALITAVLGGILVAALGPLLQAHYAEAAALAERKVKITESVAANLSGFISAHFQLVEAARVVPAAEVPDQRSLDRREEYRAMRDARHYDARRDLLLARHYFPDEVDREIDAYAAFIASVATKTAEEMPPRDEFESHASRLVAAMTQSLE